MTTITVKGTEWSKDKVKATLQVNDTFLIRSLLVIFDNQTQDEKRTESTNHNNGVGFNGSDANILSSFAKFYQKNQRLSDKQLAITRRKMLSITAKSGIICYLFIQLHQ